MSEVLACIDFSPATDRVVATAVELARSTGSRLHLLHVAMPEPELAGYDRDPRGAHTRAERADELLDEHHRLRELAEGLETQGLEVTPLVVMGSTIESILEEAERIDAGWIVVGSHGHGALHHLLVGSISEGLLRHTPRPVIVVPPEHR